MSEITVKAADGGRFMAYLAQPKSGGGPGLVLIQEIFGVNAVMRTTADSFAAQGYMVLCPDLFWRQEPGIQITDKTEAEWAKAFSLFGGFDETKGVSDLAQTLAHLRGLPGCTGKVGSVGYCLGGKLAYLMATRTDADCNVSYYGVGLDGLLDEADKIKKPILLHIAEADEFVPPESQAKVKARLSQVPQATIYSYPGQQHAFARVGGQHWSEEAAKLANGRTAEFMKKNLG